MSTQKIHVVDKAEESVICWPPSVERREQPEEKIHPTAKVVVEKDAGDQRIAELDKLLTSPVTPENVNHPRHSAWAPTAKRGELNTWNSYDQAWSDIYAKHIVSEFGTAFHKRPSECHVIIDDINAKRLGWLQGWLRAKGFTHFTVLPSKHKYFAHLLCTVDQEFFKIVYLLNV